ncbi:MAG: exodeoxyribonuclease VII small subunit [Gammaproteobacteria bacterium]
MPRTPALCKSATHILLHLWNLHDHNSSQATARAVDLEKALGELETIVEQLRSGLKMPLDKSLKEFERGVRLSQECRGALKDYEQRVQMLMGGELREFATDASDSDDDSPDSSPESQ